MSGVRSSTLSCGMRVVTDTVDTVETASLGVWVGAGTRNEPQAINGVAHLLEHMAFKGTSRRSAVDIAREIEDVGGQINAYTSREHTAYYAKVLHGDAPLAMDILADILQDSIDKVWGSATPDITPYGGRRTEQDWAATSPTQPWQDDSDLEDPY